MFNGVCMVKKKKVVIHPFVLAIKGWCRHLSGDGIVMPSCTFFVYVAWPAKPEPAFFLSLLLNVKILYLDVPTLCTHWHNNKARRDQQILHELMKQVDVLFWHEKKICVNNVLKSVCMQACKNQVFKPLKSIPRFSALQVVQNAWVGIWLGRLQRKKCLESTVIFFSMEDSLLHLITWVWTLMTWMDIAKLTA